MRSSRSGFTLFLALILAGAAAVAVFYYANSLEDSTAASLPPTPTPVPTTGVLVAKYDIAAVTTLTDDMLEVKQVPVEVKNGRALANKDQAVGKVTTVALSEGEQILTTRLGNPSQAQAGTYAYEVPVGKRAIAIVLDEVRGIGALVQPGDHVDVIGHFVVVPYDLEASSGSSDGQFIVGVETAELLDAPNADANIVSELDAEDELTILTAQGRYFQVRAGNVVGWIDAQSVAVKESEDGASAESKYKKLPESYITTYVVQNVEVLAVSQALSPSEGGEESPSATNQELDEADEEGVVAAVVDSDPVARPSAKSVTLAVTPEEAQRLLLATQMVSDKTQERDAGLRLVLRAPGDSTIYQIPPSEMGVVPMSHSVSAFNTPSFPTELVITAAGFTERIVPSGGVLEFKATVKNVSNRTIRSGSEAPPEFTYNQGVAYDELGFFPEAETYRIGLNMAGAFPTQFPYRWSLGRDLEPGETLDIFGSVRLTEPTSGTDYWFGVVKETTNVTFDSNGFANEEIVGVVTQDGVGVAEITVLPSETLTVSQTSGAVLAAPNAGAEIVREIKQGDRLEVVSAKGAWFQVRIGGETGWVEAAVVEAEPVAGRGTRSEQPAGSPLGGAADGDEAPGSQWGNPFRGRSNT